MHNIVKNFRSSSLIVVLTLSLCALTINAHGLEFKHIDDLFDVRSSIAQQGQLLPEAIRNSSGNDVRILERIFELNTSALTTIEAYFRIFKITFATREGLTPATEGILNEWLSFITSQCQYDIEYLREAKLETKNEQTLKQLDISQKNIGKLASITTFGVKENTEMLTEMSQ